MKKFFVILLIFGAVAGALAQDQAAAPASPLYFSLLADFRASLMQYSGSENTSNKYETTNKFNFMTFPGDYNVWGPGDNELKLTIGYSTDAIKGHLRMNVDRLINGSGGFVASDGKSNNRLINDILNSTFDEWNVQATFGLFGAFIGNTANRGVINAWNGFDTIKFRQDQFGVVTPGGDIAPEIPWEPPVSLPRPTPLGNWQEGKNPPENTNFGKLMNMSGNYSQEDVPYFMFTAKYAGFTVAAAGDLTGRSNASIGTWYYALNGGVRVSGEKIADLVTFDATYRFRGGDMSTYNQVDENDPQKIIQPDGRGQTTHSITLAGQIDLLNDTLGIQLAYTGMFRSYEDKEMYNTTIKTTGPLFSGIDLRFQYTGIEPFQFNFNNHVTFSSVGDTKFTGNGVKSTAVRDFWDAEIPPLVDTSYGWLALYNALGVQYHLTEKMNLWFEAGNKFSALTTTLGDAIRNDNFEIFGASLKAVYTFNPSISVEAGLAFYYASYTWKINDEKYDSIDNASGGPRLTTATKNETVFQVPLRLKIVF